MKPNTKYKYLLLLIVITSYIYSTEILFANGQINYQFIESHPFKIGFGTTPQSPTTGNLKISLKINYIDSELRLWYEISIFKEMCRAPIPQHPGLATSLGLRVHTPRPLLLYLNPPPTRSSRVV